MKDYACHWIFLSEEAGGTRAYRTTIKDDVVRANVQVLGQVQVDCLNIIIKLLLTRQTAITLTESSVLIHDAIHLDMLQEIGLEPCLDQVNIFGVSVR